MEEIVGKVSFITGGASCMGLAMAQRFATAGTKVVLADVEQHALDDAASQLEASMAGHLAIPGLGVSTDQTTSSRMAEIMENALDASIIGDMVIHAITSNELYIFSHPELANSVDERVEGMHSAFARWQQ